MISIAEIFQTTKAGLVVAFHAILKQIATSLARSKSNGICWWGASAVGRIELVVIVTVETRRLVA